MTRIFFSILLFISSNFISAQRIKSFDIGLGIPVMAGAYAGFNAVSPGAPFSPNICFNISRFQFQAGLDIYPWCIPKNVYGKQFAFKYFFRDPKKNFNYFADINFEYVKYGMGAGPFVRFDYLPTIDPEYNLIQIKSSFLTAGCGFSATFLSYCSVILIAGNGMSYYNAQFSPTNTNHDQIWNFQMGKVFSSIFYFRLGLGIKIWRNYRAGPEIIIPKIETEE